MDDTDPRITYAPPSSLWGMNTTPALNFNSTLQYVKLTLFTLS